MIKRWKYLFLIILVTFFNINVTYADNCGQIDEKITLYNNYTQALEGLDCEDTSNSETVIACNNYNTNRNIIITELMKENEKGNICDNQQDEVDKIISENEDKCGKIFDDSFSDFINGFMTIFYILGPILLIFFGSLDYTKAVVSSEADAMKKANKNFAKRLTATILLFLAPAIVNITIGMNVSDKYLSGNAYSCDFDYLVYTKEYNIRYVPRTNKSTTNQSTGGIKIGDYTIFSQNGQSYSNDKLLCGTKLTIGSAGCALTSITMQLVNSGVETTEPIDPGVLNKIIRNKGTCSGANIYWDEARHASVGEKFRLKDGSCTFLTGNINSKINQLNDFISQGYYPVIQVKHGTNSSTHYVAVLGFDGTDMKVGDPSGGVVKTLNASNYPIFANGSRSQCCLYYVAD